MRSLFLTAALALSGTAAADPGADVLVQVDKAMTNFTDSTITFEALNLKPGTDRPQTLQFRAIVKDGKNYTEFFAPGDLKGTRVLSTSATNMWIFLPEFNKVRKVATHTLAQGFMGTTLSSQDLGTTSYGGEYGAKLLSETDDAWVLDLKAKDPSKVGYAHLRMTVEKKRKVPTRIEYLADDGSVVRTQTRTEYVCPTDDYCMFGKLKMVDHTRGDAWTELKVTDFKIDSGVRDDIFTPRTLQLGL